MKHAKGGIATIALFAVAATLLVFSVVGSSQAALTYFSKTYGAQVEMHDIGVTLVENDLDENQDVSWRNYNEESNSENELDNWDKNTGKLVQEILKQPEGGEDQLRLGHKYKEELSVRNTGNIDQYVRVTIYRYWEKDGVKQPEMDSDLIDLHLVNVGGAWTEDVASRTEERTVLYYNSILGVGEASAPFSDTLEIQDEGIEAEVSRETSTDENGNTVITTKYDYDGLEFVLRVDVDAVQTHNSEDAMMSAWGTIG